ncbi:hypothetical protein HD554DRAFT_100485 [Boletus coccyginus]|nr:hypothetical protein HD554DRAFT_100485 [Boletus coccyginus]
MYIVTCTRMNLEWTCMVPAPKMSVSDVLGSLGPRLGTPMSVIALEECFVAPYLDFGGLHAQYKDEPHPAGLPLTAINRLVPLRGHTPYSCTRQTAARRLETRPVLSRQIALMNILAVIKVGLLLNALVFFSLYLLVLLEASGERKGRGVPVNSSR